MAKILLVEDDASVREVIHQALKQERHVVELAPDGEEGLTRLQCNEYDAIVLDWQLPKMAGLDVLKRFRDGGGKTPVLMLTGKSQASDKVSGLDAGADDYLTKPFNISEFSARIRALLRRNASDLASNNLQVGDITLDKSSYTASRAGKSIRLLPKEFALLEFMMRHPDTVFSAEALLSRVWTIEEEASSDIIRTHIKNLRKKLDTGDGDSPIQTVHGVGYKLVRS
jgi:DNA-binding response OmpR family regulator